MYKKILIATDGSELAQRAVEQGISLAKSLNASVMFVTVTELWSPLEMAGAAELGSQDAVRGYEDAAAQSAKEILKQANELAASAGIASETRHIADRRPAEGILDTAELYDCELIVMASHGRRGLQKMLVGSQTSEVIALSKRPVLVVR
ncbi:universal stress protein [Ruegeria arenilitoris]|uniref:universal stress protein n=1 Tax=Ruegeria arenilitoris TaxID=1173585 RepID=UPI00147A7320|nr:universal stress protein [Ruegeria arenilitoris]